MENNYKLELLQIAIYSPSKEYIMLHKYQTLPHKSWRKWSNEVKTRSVEAIDEINLLVFRDIEFSVLKEINYIKANNLKFIIFCSNSL